MKAQFTHYLISIDPNEAAIIRMLKYRLAMVWRIVSAVMQRMSIGKQKNNVELLTEENLHSLTQEQNIISRNEDGSKPKILLLGPYHYKQPMWSVRAKAALPDLIAPLLEIGEVHWVTPIPNRKILLTIDAMREGNKFYHHLLPPSYNLKSLPEQAQVMDELIYKIKPQIVMNAFGIIASGFDAVSSAKRHNILSVLRVPGDELNAKKKMQKEMMTNKTILDVNKANFAISNADHVMVMSDSEQKRISKEHQREQNTFIQIRGVDSNIFKPHKTKNFHEKILKVGFAGRLTLEKGTDILLETVEQLQDNSNIEFHVASPEKLEEQRLKKYNNLKWRGYISHEQVPAFMQEIHVLILPSHMEGRSQTMMEAMSCGLPVLMQKHIHPEKLSGMIHCTTKAETFTQEILKLEADREYLMEISNQARQSAVEQFDKITWSKSMTSKFKSVLDSA